MKLKFITGQYDNDIKKQAHARLKQASRNNSYSSKKILINERGWQSRLWGMQ